jgi:hypothetical protein
MNRTSNLPPTTITPPNGETLIAEEKRHAKAGLLKTPVALVDDVTALYLLRFLDKARRRGAAGVSLQHRKIGGSGKEVDAGILGEHLHKANERRACRLS